MSDPNVLRGPTQAKIYVATFLKNRLPGYLAYLRPLWGLTTDTLPDPVMYRAQESLALDKHPQVYVGVPNQTAFKLDETSEGDDMEYVTTYAVRVYSTAKVAGWEETLRQRDDLSAAVRFALARHADLDVTPSGIVQLDQTSFRTDYSDPTPVQGDRYVAIAQLTFDLDVYETVSEPPIGIVGEIDLDISLMEP